MFLRTRQPNRISQLFQQLRRKQTRRRLPISSRYPNNCHMCTIIFVEHMYKKTFQTAIPYSERVIVRKHFSQCGEHVHVQQIKFISMYIFKYILQVEMRFIASYVPQIRTTEFLEN